MATERGFIVSAWREKNGTYSCEISKPQWPGSSCFTKRKLKDAMKAAWKEAQTDD